MLLSAAHRCSAVKKEAHFVFFLDITFIPRYPRGSSDTFMVFRHIGRAGFACAGQGKKPPDKTGGKNGRDAANRLEDQRQLCCGVGGHNHAAELPQSLHCFKFFGEREKRKGRSESRVRQSVLWGVRPHVQKRFLRIR